jgi:hypothetical protein
LAADFAAKEWRVKNDIKIIRANWSQCINYEDEATWKEMYTFPSLSDAFGEDLIL